MNVLILSRKFEIYSTRRLVEEIQSRGHTCLLWDPAWPASKCFADFDVLIPRLGSFQFPEACLTLESLSSRGGVIINDLEAYRKARNKWRSYVEFLENQIPTPYSEFVSERDKSLWALWKKGYPCILKKLEASKGEGVFLAQTPEELEQLVNSMNEEFLIQEAFPESFGEDIRAFVVGDKIVASMKRKSTHDFRSNLSLGAVGEVCTLSPTEEELVLKTTAALKMDIAGVDLLRTHKGSLILEANPCPGLEGIEKYTPVNVARAIIEHIEEMHEHHSASGRTSTYLRR
ncbi:ATP-grasp domain-containing protein [Bdellovibrio svalbardensis]|uniref:RimK family alpha-L-glutamate ligase n=1 Tax=Bdellovibrio svalbardensis TaxID=2972972 RepID=A0ABT6DIN0_9BACT|nr:RimK family alpha-L-glutamate ligase [Bdellovibrio svalbardensis]MDG0816362.1 RimK family alpha-L-glutamate ligase [Bdellovibrio svalbardensis]